MYTLYKIYYGSAIVYIGRTTQPLQNRLRGHFFKKPMHKVIDIFQVTKVEYAETNTIADMYLYEIYYINKLKPLLNVDDKAKDNLTIELPELCFKIYEIKLLEKWKKEIQTKLDKERIIWVSKKLHKENYSKKRLQLKNTLSKSEFSTWLSNNPFNKNNYKIISEEEYLKWCLTNKTPF